MQLTLTSTNQITEYDGVPVRVWEGITPNGIPCFVFVHRIAVVRTKDTDEFDRELREQLPPSVVVRLESVLFPEIDRFMLEGMTEDPPAGYHADQLDDDRR